MPRPKISCETQKETIEFDMAFLENWNVFCDAKGYLKRHASHAAIIAFMSFSAEQREELIRQTMKQLKGDG